MIILEIDDNQLQFKDLQVSNDVLTFLMQDDRSIEAPIWWHPCLASASKGQKDKWEIPYFGNAVAWHDIDEFISEKALVMEGSAPGAKLQAEAIE